MGRIDVLVTDDCDMAQRNENPVPRVWEICEALERHHPWSEPHDEIARRVFRQFFTMEINVSVFRVPVFWFIHGFCRVMLTPFSLNIAPLALVWTTVTPGSLL